MRKFAIEIKYAVLFTLAMIVWTIGEKEVGLHGKYIAHYSMLGMLSGIIGLVVYFFALREKKKEYFNGQMTWAQGFVSGVYMSFFIGLLSPLATYISFNIVSPYLFQNLVGYVVSKGVMNKEQAELYFSFRSYAIQAAFSSLSLGVITGAIVALVLKTKTSGK